MKIAVIGCGPGGLASALLLNRAGHQLVLFDQFDQPRPLGSGLLIQPSGQAVLAKLGLLATAEALAAPVVRLYGMNVASGKRALDMEYRYLGESAKALGIHRASLFDLLFDAVVAARIEIRTGCKLAGATRAENGMRPEFGERTQSEPFDILIDASGANSPLASGKMVELPFAALWTTVDCPADTGIAVSALDQRYDGARKMAGIMPIGINPASGKQGAALFWSMKPDDYPAMRMQGIAHWRDVYLSIWPEAEPFVRQIDSFDQLTLALYRHRTGPAVSQGRIFHVGDSWHCTSPQLGQGANMALLDAAALAVAIDQRERPEETAQLYRHLRADHVGLYQLLSYIFTPLYQSDSALHPVVRDTIIHHFAGLPIVRQMIAQVVSGNFANFTR